MTPPDGQVDFGVAPTGSIARGGEFVCLLDRASAAAAGVKPGDLGVVVRDVPGQGELFAICRLRVDDADPERVARLDQTLRKALGIGDAGSGTTVRIHGIWRPWHRRAADAVARLLGAQYLHLRVRKAEILDAEKQVCRVQGDAFMLVGCGHGDVVVCEGVRYDERSHRYEVRRLRLRALEGVTSPSPMDVVPEAPLLGQPHDLRWIRLDEQARGELNVELLASLRIRRDVRRRVVDGVRDAGIAFFLSLFAVLSLIEARGATLVLVVASLALLAGVYVIWKIRSELP